MNLPPEMDNLKEEIKRQALAANLDFFDVVFELCSYDQINQIAALGGFPTRYPHWRFGMEYEKLSKSYTWGLSKIYEMVINNDPCYAYLMLSNPMVDQKLVMAHVYAHSDFFKNNCFFAHTSRKAIDEMANHGARIRSHADRHGHEAVENFLDVCFSLENLIDIHSPAIRRHETGRRRARFLEDGEEEDPAIRVERIRAKDYMDRFINPEEFLKQKHKELEEERERKKRFPEEPERDVLLFLIENAPLESWQRNILAIIREEAYYFAPQWMTKIMNEGWASYWHSKLMAEKLCTDQEIIDFADHHSGTVAQGQGAVNPYKIGIELFRDIEDRWNKGRHGKAWEDCANFSQRILWDTGEGLGREKIFEVRKHYNDVMFIDDFLTEEFCEERRLFTYRFNAKTGLYEVASRSFEEIKRQFLASLTNGGHPFISVLDGNYANRGELFLQHRFEGVELRIDYARDTLRNLQKIWSRPVHLETVIGGKGRIFTYDGQEHQEKETSVEVPCEVEME